MIQTSEGYVEVSHKKQARAGEEKGLEVRMESVLFPKDPGAINVG